MIETTPGATINPVIENGPPGQVGTLRHGIRLKPDTMVVAFTTAGIVETVVDADTSTYTGALVVPVDADTDLAYEVVWDDGTEIVATDEIVWVLEDWVPTPDEVAELVSAYAREHVGGYNRPAEEQAGRERATFTTNTDPTYAQVEAFIATAVDEIVGRVGVDPLPAGVWGLAKTAAKWHAAASVEAKRRPAQTDEQSGLYRAFISNYRNSLDALIEQARWTPLELK